MSDVTVMYNIEGYWFEINVDCLDSLINAEEVIILSSTRLKGDK